MINKGAMFGLFRALRKQSGGLFLAKRHSMDSQKTRGSFKTNRGAMFGLDARIALAIFGALSVISGAALYSAIQQSKATALYNDMIEVGKAWEQYMLDTGSDLPIGTDTTLRHRRTVKLISDNANGWKGPYLSQKASTTLPEYADHHKYSTITLPAASKAEWGEGHSNYANWSHASLRCNDTTVPCYTFIQFSKADFSIKEKVDELVDGGDGAYSGKLRWYTAGAQTVMALQYAPHKMPQ